MFSFYLFVNKMFFRLFLFFVATTTSLLLLIGTNCNPTTFIIDDNNDSRSKDVKNQILFNWAIRFVNGTNIIDKNNLYLIDVSKTTIDSQLYIVKLREMSCINTICRHLPNNVANEFRCEFNFTTEINYDIPTCALNDNDDDA